MSQDTDEALNFGVDDDPETVGDCDCCGRRAVLSRVWYGGILETWACEPCRQWTP